MSATTWISDGDLPFYLLALVTLAGAVATSLRRDPLRARWSLAMVAGGLAGLSLLLGAPPVAALQLAVAAGGVVALGRPAVRLRADGGRDDAGRQADVHAAGPYAGWRASLLVLAFFLISSRAVLMARWPLMAAAGAAPGAAAGAAVRSMLPAVGLPHYLVTALVLFSAGLLVAVMRRSIAGLAVGVHFLGAAAALGIVAVSHFVTGGTQGQLLAVLAVLAGAASATTAIVVGVAGGFPERAAEQAARALSTVLAGVALALLAGAW